VRKVSQVARRSANLRRATFRTSYGEGAQSPQEGCLMVRCSTTAFEMRIYNDRMLFEGFSLSRIELGDVTLRVRHGGNGPPLLLLHGHPQTHMIWHALAPRLAQDFTVIAPDLRGYGESSKPETTSDHMPYSKRVMPCSILSLQERHSAARI
jgi:hypothetical protein